MKHFLLIPIAFLLSTCNLTTQENEVYITKGIYGSPSPLWEKGYVLSEQGVNALFVHSGSINNEMIDRARKDSLKIYAEFPTLNGKNYVGDHPEAWPINEKGEKSPQASWFMGVCPNNAGFKEYRFKQLRNLLNQYDLDGIWMDYVHWHAQFEEPEPILPETCFCEDCLSAFQEKTNIEIPSGDTPEKAAWILSNEEETWRDWRCSVIRDWTIDIRRIIEEIKPGILLGIYHCPWNDDEFNGARRRILGLDYDMLRDVVDVFSPMVYHGRMERSANWVGDNITWFCDRLNIREKGWPKVWTIVQAYDDPHEISPKEFETVLRGGLSGCATGIMMFTSYAMADKEEKVSVMKKVYSEKD